ncbi:MAG: hypothetical protein E1N59_3127 [Puniceicoccaceae bacterium 5H]|nr:MAG: hypothetical protein E1N59_3127 [Puniceicoccaceae bacterium 5H]
MKIATTIARYLLGLIFVVFGLNAFFNFIPMPPPSGQAAAFMGALFTSGYLYAIKVLEILGGVLLLASKRTTPLGLLILGPIVVNIILFSLFLAPSGLGMATVVGVLALFLLGAHRRAFAGVVQPPVA